jgi:hypothetical protein
MTTQRLHKHAPMIALAALAAAAGCQAAGPVLAPPAAPDAVAVRPMVYPTPVPTPAARLYVDHGGVLSIYKLPLVAASKPVLILPENPGSVSAPAIAVDQYGEIAIGTTAEVRLYEPPVKTLKAKAAKLHIPLTTANTAIGVSGAELVDLEFDPQLNLWLLSGIAGEVTELQRPLTSQSVAVSTVLFGVPGTKTAGFGQVIQARFDVSGNLYVYAVNSSLPPPQSEQLFKESFPYVKPVSTTGLNLEQVDYVDPSQFPPSNPNPVSVTLGQYNGPLHSPPPQAPPPAPVDQLSQFASPINTIQGPYPSASVNYVAGALIADPPRARFYTLDAIDGRLRVWGLPLENGAAPSITIACHSGKKRCTGGSEHLWLGP